MHRIYLTVRGAFGWSRLDHNVNLFWMERHETKKRREEHNRGSIHLFDASLSTGDKTLRLIHTLSSQLLTDLLCPDLLHNMHHFFHRYGQAFPILRRGTLRNCNLLLCG